MVKKRTITKEIDLFKSKIQQLENQAVDLLLSAVVFAHNEKDIKPLNEFVSKMVSIEGFSFNLDKIATFIENNFQLLWDYTKNEFSIKNSPKIISSKELDKFTSGYVLECICSESKNFSVRSYKNTKPIDHDQFMKILQVEDIDERYGKFGLPKDKNYNKYRVKIRRK